MKPLIIIPARGGSKGLPGKNIKKLNGVPLIHYTINAARELFSDERIFVSTDTPEICDCAERTGLEVPFLRPEELATDTAGSYEVIMHALQSFSERGLEIDTVILLQPTSPLRTSEHLNKAIQAYSDTLDMLVSVKETDANPYYVLKEENQSGFLESSKVGNFTRRQDCPSVYELNGAIYIINRESIENKKITDFTKVKKYVMDKKSSVDIDDLIDFKLAELLIREVE